MTTDNLEKEETDRPQLDAWRKTGGDGKTDRIVVGHWWHGPKRIEADPDDLMMDPDAEVGDG